MDNAKINGDLLVTLPSNSNMASYPNNEPSNYTVQLAHPIELKGDWEVALVSVQYTHNWISTDSAIFIRFLLFEKDINKPDRKEASDFWIDRTTQRMTDAATALSRHDNTYTDPPVHFIAGIKHKVTYIMPQHFHSAQALGDEVCRAFQIAFPNTTAKLFYFYNHAQCKGRFVVNNADIAILSLDKRLGELLGHTSSPISCGLCTEIGQPPSQEEIRRLLAARQMPLPGPNDYIDTRHWYILERLSSKKPKIKTVSSLWVYTDFIENQYVGNYKVPLLGVIPVSAAAAGTRTHYCVNPVYFVGVTKSHLDTIQIKLVSERGERIPYVKNAGDETNVICCLRFRRRKSALPI